MNIGEAAKRTGISIKMLRYYEEIGLLRPALRTSSGYRVYQEHDVATLRFVRRARDLGFQVREIATLLGLWHDQARSSAEVKAVALAHVAELEERRRTLDEMIETLRHLAETCNGDTRPDCPILGALETGAGTAPVPQSPPRPGFAAAL
ncbi:Cu(I)-responsive transcriptional regulator [Marinovum sp.]|uniref:Cu(I)-responsive transcriptional regulator n=1 Tax=Marinovum sp. TaxID=2024839 RepID=UPI003A93560B